MFELNELIKLLEDVSSSISCSRIFWTLLKNGEVGLSELIRQTRLNHKIVRKNIDRMIEKGLIKEKRFGRLKVYVLNDSDPSVKMLLNIAKQVSYEPPPSGQ
ncbi:MAG: hypothetical protein ACUVQ0_05660 [Thermoproteota archaeon]